VKTEVEVGYVNPEYKRLVVLEHFSALAEGDDTAPVLAQIAALPDAKIEAFYEALQRMRGNR